VAAGGMSFKVEVPAGRIWTLRVEADGFNPVTVPLVIGAGEESSMPVMLTPSTPAPRGNSSGGRPRTKKTEEHPAQTPQTPQKAPEKAPETNNPNLVNPF
jgi:hypothetical protein